LDPSIDRTNESKDKWTVDEGIKLSEGRGTNARCQELEGSCRAGSRSNESAAPAQMARCHDSLHRPSE
jgi:hypothetical protein